MISKEAGLIQPAVLSDRLGSIDALRGFVMILMLVDHMRETFYLHAHVSDPVDALTTSPELFYTRLPVRIWWLDFFYNSRNILFEIKKTFIAKVYAKQVLSSV